MIYIEWHFNKDRDTFLKKSLARIIICDVPYCFLSVFDDIELLRARISRKEDF